MFICLTLLIIAWLVDMPLYASMTLTVIGCATLLSELYLMISALDSGAKGQDI